MHDLVIGLAIAVLNVPSEVDDSVAEENRIKFSLEAVHHLLKLRDQKGGSFLGSEVTFKSMHLLLHGVRHVYKSLDISLEFVDISAEKRYVAGLGMVKDDIDKYCANRSGCSSHQNILIFVALAKIEVVSEVFKSLDYWSTVSS
jgi:hypothetical protein